MKKKILLVLGLLFISIGLIACEKEPEEVEKVTITFNVDGGLPTLPPKEVNKGEIAVKPSDPEKADYEFLGWYLNEALYEFILPVNEDITLIAKWEAIEYFEVTFDFDFNEQSEKEIVIKNGKVSMPNSPNRPGYLIEEWQLDGIIFDFNSPITTNITLKALWKEVAINKIELKDGNVVVDLDEFMFEDILLEVTYIDNYKKVISLSKDLIVEEDFSLLFLTGPFYIGIEYGGKTAFIPIEITSNNPQTILPNVVIYALKEIVNNQVMYTFYTLDSTMFVSLEIEIDLDDLVGQIDVVNYFEEGLFSYEENSGKLNVVYSFGKNVTGSNKLFSITASQELKISYNKAKTNIYKFVEGEVIKEEDIGLFVR